MAYTPGRVPFRKGVESRFWRSALLQTISKPSVLPYPAWWDFWVKVWPVFVSHPQRITLDVLLDGFSS
jgi:hypothetical protein